MRNKNKTTQSDKRRRSLHVIVPMQGSKVGHSDGQLSVGPEPVREHEAVAGAVHGLHAPLGALHVEHKHILLRGAETRARPDQTRPDQTRPDQTRWRIDGWTDTDRDKDRQRVVISNQVMVISIYYATHADMLICWHAWQTDRQTWRQEGRTVLVLVSLPCSAARGQIFPTAAGWICWAWSPPRSREPSTTHTHTHIYYPHKY